MIHGLSNRLIGGPANPNCQDSLQAGGMGEGWSDFVATIMSTPATATRATDTFMGPWITNGQGARPFPYSTNMQTNPTTFNDLTQLNEVHDIGTVWASMMYEAFWNMADASGLVSPEQIGSSPDNGTGNTDMMKLLVQSMMISPCNPTFVQARDALLKAEQIMFKGQYACAITNAFAKRGLGVGAVDDTKFVNNFDVPNPCKQNGDKGVPAANAKNGTPGLAATNAANNGAGPNGGNGGIGGNGGNGNRGRGGNGGNNRGKNAAGKGSKGNKQAKKAADQNTGGQR
ncbi:Fungalysin metallopeptidase-domain-containing protein [Chytriomyces sp. MP71]|nr:Fungalysin metallopeptidase-domain-containing protein [Chytriomyces sp. MP71]